MAEETRYYGAEPAPAARPSGTPLGLAETEVASTMPAARAAEAAKPDAAAVPAIQQAVPVDLAPGTEVGEYRVVRKLGQGGMGAVYEAEQPAIGKRVAVKVLAPHYAQDIELVRRFLDEARAVNLIRHPNIVDIFSFGELPGLRPYFVMEYLDGESLAEAIEHEHLRPDEIRRLLRQICSALAATHAVGIVHRDLKPENIWIARPRCGESYAKLLDFGIAKLVDPTRTNLTQTGVAMGTPLYMSPEQCLGRPVDARADIYAMGVLLYRIFTGRHPFSGRATGALVFQHVSEPPPPPSSLRPLPAGLERLILDCLAKDPEARPGSAEVLGKRIEAELAAWPGHRMATTIRGADAALAMPPVGIPELVLRDERTLPVRAQGAGRWRWVLLGLGLAAAGAILGAWLVRRTPEAAPVARPPEVARPAAVAKPTAPVALPEPVVPAEPPRASAEKKSSAAKAGSRARGKAKAAISPRPEAAALLPAATIEKAAEAQPEPAEAKPPSMPVPAETAPPAPRPTRAQERGLLDENPLRR
ncbi:MAG: protein kinase [Deltaproteobacteria bacterium]|nr:protein kinase [Deltaproteobacteria bacterium]